MLPASKDALFRRARALDSRFPAIEQTGPFIEAGQEPTLDDVLGEPIVHAMMRSDRVGHEDLRALLLRAKRRLRDKKTVCLN